MTNTSDDIVRPMREADKSRTYLWSTERKVPTAALTDSDSDLAGTFTRNASAAL